MIHFRDLCLCLGAPGAANKSCNDNIQFHALRFDLASCLLQALGREDHTLVCVLNSDGCSYQLRRDVVCTSLRKTTHVRMHADLAARLAPGIPSYVACMRMLASGHQTDASLRCFERNHPGSQGPSAAVIKLDARDLDDDEQCQMSGPVML